MIWDCIEKQRSLKAKKTLSTDKSYKNNQSCKQFLFWLYVSNLQVTATSVVLCWRRSSRKVAAGWWELGFGLSGKLVLMRYLKRDETTNKNKRPLKTQVRRASNERLLEIDSYICSKKNYLFVFVPRRIMEWGRWKKMKKKINFVTR